MTTLPLPLQHLPDPVLIVGGYGYRNAGDEAILASILRSLEGRRVTVLSRTPAETTAMHGVRSIPLTAAAAGAGSPSHRAHRWWRAVRARHGRRGTPVARLRARSRSPGQDWWSSTGWALTMGCPRRPRCRSGSSRSGHTRSPSATRRRLTCCARGASRPSWVPISPPGCRPPRPRSARGCSARPGIDPRRPVIGLALTAVNPDLAESVLEAATATVDDAARCAVLLHTDEPAPVRGRAQRRGPRPPAPGPRPAGRGARGDAAPRRAPRRLWPPRRGGRHAVPQPAVRGSRRRAPDPGVVRRQMRHLDCRVRHRPGRRRRTRVGQAPCRCPEHRPPSRSRRAAS